VTTVLLDIFAHTPPHMRMQSLRKDMRKKNNITRCHDLVTLGNELQLAANQLLFFSFTCPFVGSVAYYPQTSYNVF